jgi:hypothetical protein
LSTRTQFTEEKFEAHLQKLEKDLAGARPWQVANLDEVITTSDKTRFCSIKVLTADNKENPYRVLPEQARTVSIVAIIWANDEQSKPLVCTTQKKSSFLMLSTKQHG